MSTTGDLQGVVGMLRPPVAVDTQILPCRTHHIPESGTKREHMQTGRSTASFHSLTTAETVENNQNGSDRARFECTIFIFFKILHRFDRNTEAFVQVTR